LIKRILYGSGAASALAAAYLIGSLTLGGAFAASPSQPSPIAPSTSQVISTSHAPPSTATNNEGTAKAETTDQGTGTQDAQPSYTSSVTAPQDQSGQSEANEEAALQSKAKITADQARAAALAQFKGATVTSVHLENENGNVVYGVELTDSSGTAQDVKVDAGNGNVLRAEAGGVDNSGAGESDGGTKAAETNR